MNVFFFEISEPYPPMPKSELAKKGKSNVPEQYEESDAEKKKETDNCEDEIERVSFFVCFFFFFLFFSPPPRFIKTYFIHIYLAPKQKVLKICFNCSFWKKIHWFFFCFLKQSQCLTRNTRQIDFF